MAGSAQVKAPPKQVREAAKQAEAVQRQLVGTETPIEDVEAARNEEIDRLLHAVETPSPERLEETPEVTPEVTPEEPKAPREDWKQKYHVLQGKYDAEVPRLHEELKDLKDSVNKLTAAPTEAATPEASKPFKYIKEEELEDYGPEFMDMVGRAARDIAEQQTSSLQNEITELKNQLGTTGQRVQNTEQQGFYYQLDRDVKDWREINQDKKFVAWLDMLIPETDTRRQDALMDAFNHQDVGKVASFFRNYASTQENANTPTEGAVPNGAGGQPTLSLESMVSPTAGQGNPPQGAPAQQQKKIWTQPEIDAFYKASRQGKFKGREADKATIEADILNAAATGRVQ